MARSIRGDRALSRSVRPLRLLGAFALLIPLLATGTGDAAIASRTPTSFRSVRAILQKGQKAVFTCRVSGTTGMRTSFAALSLTTPSGRKDALGFSVLSSSSDRYVGVRVGATGAAQTVSEGTGGSSGTETTKLLVLQNGSVLRAAWAAWGSSLTCSVQIDGRAARSVPQPKGRARYLLPTDFEGGVGLLTSSGSAVAQQSYRRTSRGYLFAFFAPEWGSTTVESPKGRRYQESGDWPWITMAEPTAGTWRYAVDMGRSDDGFPWLWIIELPR